jgi:hypothetical protein
MMEKYDGIRVFWDGKSLVTSNSKTHIELPKDANFPSIRFEGELWYKSLIQF